MAWDTIPAPNYPTTSNASQLGNALANLVGDYQQAQQGQQRTQANDLRNQQDQMLLDQARAFAGGVPMLPNGMLDLPQIQKTLLEKGDLNSISALMPLILE